MAGRHNLEREVLHRKVSQKKRGDREGQVPVCRLLCEVSGDCQAVLKTPLDREVRGRLITKLRGKGEVLYRALCGLWSWVSSTERFEQRVLLKMAEGDAVRAKSFLKLSHRSFMTRAGSPVWKTVWLMLCSLCMSKHWCSEMPVCHTEVLSLFGIELALTDRWICLIQVFYG